MSDPPISKNQELRDAGGFFTHCQRSYGLTPEETLELLIQEFGHWAEMWASVAKIAGGAREIPYSSKCCERSHAAISSRTWREMWS